MKKKILSFMSNVYKGELLKKQQKFRDNTSMVFKSGARVISIGNITWGGTGKTPLVAKLAQDLAFFGKKVAVLTRGYGGGDEVEELRRKLPNTPILVGKDRAKLAEEAVKKHGADTILLDDGFQYLGLHRDLDIVTINSTLPFGPGGLIPAGTLREPIEHLSRAHVFVLTKSNIGSKNLHWISQKLASVKPGAVIFEAIHKPLRFWDPVKKQTVVLSEIDRKKIATISGIEDPHSFEKTVEQLGAEILLAARFQDHHPFKQAEVTDFLRRAEMVGVKDIVTTEKDLMRLEPFFKKGLPHYWSKFNFWVLEIEFQISDEEDFIRRCANP